MDKGEASMLNSDSTIHENKGISGSTLKLIAIVTMLIDHTAAVILERIDTGFVYQLMRSIGRLAFPIFCFLLVEGFLHTRSVKKYALRLAAFALISDIPFDLALAGKPFDFRNQNVYFTLLIGLLVMMGLQYINVKAVDKKSSFQKANIIFADFAVLSVGVVLAEFLKTDYAGFGVLTIAVMYWLRRERFLSMMVGCFTLTIMSINEFPAFLVLYPIWFYNGKRGLNLKYIFYAFYPVHLLILYLICCFMGIV